MGVRCFAPGLTTQGGCSLQRREVNGDELRPSGARFTQLASQPLAWLAFGVAGLLLMCVGVALDVYRHDHGADAGELLSFANPGMLVALAGAGIVASALLMTLSLLAFQAAGSAEAVVRRGIWVGTAWIAVASAAAGAVMYISTAGVTISHHEHGAAADGTAAQRAATATPGSGAGAFGAAAARARVTLRGTLTLDGAPLEAEFLGARVRRGGLDAACQLTIPPVTAGRYEIQVLADAEAPGCGAPGAELFLWTYANDRIIYSPDTVPWPEDGATVVSDASFSSAAPDGATLPATAFKGEAISRDATDIPRGTAVEAYVGDVRCGIASIRHENQAFTLFVAGPESVQGCARDATLTFRVGGRPAVETARNDLVGDDRDPNDVLILTVQ